MKTSMEFFLDIDGVILDFEKGFMDFIRTHYLPDLPIDYLPKTWEMVTEFKQLNIDEVWPEFMLSDGFINLDLLIDAQSFNHLAKKYPVHLITNLPRDKYHRREQNLLYHKLNFTSLHLGGHYNFEDESYPSKSKVVGDLRTPGKRLIFLDDHPKNCEDIKDEFPRSEVFLMTRPHNKNIDANKEWTRVPNWHNFLDLVCQDQAS